MDDDTLLRELARQWRDGANPPLTEEQLQQAEARLGFALPPLLRRFYGEVGNGVLRFYAAGSRHIIGPVIFPLTTPGESTQGRTLSVIAWYRSEKDGGPSVEERAEAASDGNPLPELPERLLMIADWGCNIYSWVDCSTPALPVLRNDNNRSLATFAVEAPSLQEWLERQLHDENLFPFDWASAEKVTFAGEGAG